MSKSTVKVVEIDTNPAVKSLKDLRKELMEYKNQMANLEEGSDAFLEVANKAGEAKHQIDEINQSIRGASSDFGDMVGNVTNVAAGITGAFQAVAGGLQAIGVESEALDKTIAKMQGLMAVTQGLSAIDDGIKSLKKLQKSITATTGVAKVFKTVLQPKVLLAVTAAITALVAIWNKWGDSIKEALPFLGKTTKQLEAEKKASEEAAAAKKKLTEEEESYRKKVGSAIQGTLSDYKLLQAQYRRLSSDYQKMRWIENNKEAFDKLGLSVKNLKDAEDKFVNNTDAVVKSLIKRAIATAKQQQLTELASKYTEAKVKAEQEYEKKKVGAGSVAPGSSHTAGAYEYVDRNGRWVYTEEGANKANEKLQKQLNAEADLFYQQMNALAAEIADEMSIDKILQGINNAANGGTSGTATKIVDETKDKALGLVEFTDADLQSGLERVKKYWENVYDIQLEQLKRSGKEKEKQISDEIELAKNSLSLYEEGTVEYENQLTHIANLENELNAAKEKQISDEIEIEKNRLLLYKEGTLEYEKQLTKISDLEIGLKEVKENEVIELALENDRLKEMAKGWLYNEETAIETFDRISEELKLALDRDLITHKQYNDAVKNLTKERTRYIVEQSVKTFSAASNFVTTLLDGIADQQDTNNKEGFEKSKKLQIASATIGMLTGITNAIAGLFTTKSGPWDIALAAIQAATIAASGTMQIQKIKNTKFDGGGAANVSAGAINNMIVPPVQFSQAVQGASTQGAITNQKVYVTESDIVNTIGKVNVQESENTY